MGAMSYEKGFLKSARILENKLSQDGQRSFLLYKQQGNKQRVGASGWFSLKGGVTRRLLQRVMLGPLQLNKLTNHLEEEARG